MVSVPSPGPARGLRRPRTVCALLVGATLLDAVFPAVVIALDMTSPSLDPWRHTLSRHAHAHGLPWMEVAFVAHGAAMCVLAVAMSRLPPTQWAAPTALWLGGVASLLLAVFAVDARGEVSVAGVLHQAIAPVAFLGVAAAGVLAWQAQRRSPHWGRLARTPGAFAWGLLIALTAFGLLLAVVQFHDGPRIVLGATERLVVLGISGWVLAQCVQGCRVALRPSHAGAPVA